ncbi:glycine--tRNA ligase subunit beta [Methyloterricola oryzae]|uniref:glycine--tRNA ligase subunit beta n=1 Tax=Methyloterricola oryzae TaxID=1495050 RepID=UPI0005EB45BC|nr:glycine--tRNA ligase subunit beta [Methyloterricola oryzae]
MAENRDLLFELGTEELPPKSLLNLATALKTSVEASLAQTLEHSGVTVYATPRRLALCVKALAARQPDYVVEKRGPALNAAFDADGKPTKATEGFARSCGTSVDQLFTQKTDKGEWLFFRETKQGATVAELLPRMLNQALLALPIAKRMRWGAGTAEFVRPAHWVVLLYGSEVIAAEILGLSTGRITRGHRFHSSASLELASASEYPQRLRDEGHVIAHFDERRACIKELAEQTAAAAGGIAHIEPELLDEVTALVEWPVPVLGNFEPRYLALPAEVLITTMQENQKYFPVKNAQGALLPHFITFSNIESSRPDTVREGNERVVRPRLSDAEFFWNQDRRKTLEQRVPDLANITFQKTLGSVLDKTHRVQRLAAHIAGALETQSAWVERAALLAKADLLTEMVGEFTNLQGTMGRYYALAEGEPEEIAAAIEEQYLPKVSGGALPETRTGQILALAEKIETLAGIFSAGLIPSGDKDPYALRRAALGALRILAECGLDLDLEDLIAHALQSLSHPFDRETTQTAVRDFVLERLRGYSLDKGYRHDEIDAVLDMFGRNPLDYLSRLKAVREFRGLPESASLAAANKRIRNILRKSEEAPVANVDENVLTEAPEHALLRAARDAEAAILPLLQQRDYTAALCRLAVLKEPVDAFFDGVMVMAEDPALRANRLGLLAIVDGLFMDIADISRLQADT